MKKEVNSAVQVENRRLAAIMFTDIVGFSRQMGSNEARTLRLLDTHNHIIQQAVTAHHGTVIKTVGDAFLVDFPSVVHAVQCAQQIQAQLRACNADTEPAEHIHVRIGVHLGDVVQRDRDVFGDGVNIASRLQGLAEPDTICISQAVYKEVERKLSLGTVVSLGRPKLKNIAQREPVYALLSAAPQTLCQRLQGRRLQLKPWQRPLQVTALLVLLVSAGLSERYFYVPSPASLPLPDKSSIVVLPFTNMSGEPEQEYFSDGLTEDLTSDLSQISSLFVIARHSAFTYKGKAVTLQDVSREMGVRYVLEGSVRKANDQIRVTAQLIDGMTGGHLWSARYDRPFGDIFALQDEIGQKIVTALKVKLIQDEQERFRRAPTDNQEAYDYYLCGLEHFSRTTKEANTQARQMFEKAVELDSQYAQAYPSLGTTYFWEWINEWSQDPQTLEQALGMAQRAIALSDSLPGAHLLLGNVYLWKNKQHERAIAEGERAIALDPNDASGYAVLATFLIWAGRPEEAIGMVEKAMRLNPHYPPLYLFFLGHAYRLTGRYEEAVGALKRLLARSPNFLAAHVGLVIIYI